MIQPHHTRFLVLLLIAALIAGLVLCSRRTAGGSVIGRSGHPEPEQSAALDPLATGIGVAIEP